MQLRFFAFDNIRNLYKWVEAPLYINMILYFRKTLL